MNKLTLGSLFDGSGGFPLAGLLCGITPVWASEIEPFPIRVTTKRLPSMKHYGDISALDGGKVEPVDIITFGSPCQDLSVAGKRAGLEDGERSNLFYQAIRIIKEMRSKTNGKYPRYIVWENVPGAFSSNSGQDFRSVLEAVCSVKTPDIHIPMPANGKWANSGNIVADDYSIAWRVLDAQYWGVPQRRRRIFLVADFASRSAEEILFECESVSRHFTPCVCAWQGTAHCIKTSIDATGYDGYNGDLTGDKAATLGVNCGLSTGRNGVVLNDQGGNRMDVTEDVTCTLRAEAHHPPCVLLENHPADSRIKICEDGKVQTLSSRMGTGGGNVPLLMKIRCGSEGGGKGPLIQKDKSATIACNNDQTLFEPCSWDGGQVSPTLTKQNAGGNQRMPDKDNFNCVLQAYGICAKNSNSMMSSNPHSGFYEADSSRTLDGNGGNPTCNQGGIAVVETYALQGSMIGRKDENSPQGDGINEDVCFTLDATDRHAVYCMTTGSYTDIGKEQSPTLMARDYKDPNVVNEPVYGIGRDTFNQGTNAKFKPSFEEELEPPLMAKGPGAVIQAEPEYTVRRLTPIECARLQGFPDWWCFDLGTEKPSYADIAYWKNVFETYRKIVSPEVKPKTQAQIIKWLKDPYSDAAEYKMWGNGVALPCVFYVLSGIAQTAKKKGAD